MISIVKFTVNSPTDTRGARFEVKNEDGISTMGVICEEENGTRIAVYLGIWTLWVEEVTMRLLRDPRDLISMSGPQMSNACWRALCMYLDQRTGPPKELPPPVEVTFVTPPPIDKTTPEEASRPLVRFFEINNMEPPKMVFDSIPMDPRHLGIYIKSKKQLEVYPSRCRGKSGGLEDMSVLGVAAHEASHHVNELLGWKKVNNAFWNAWQQEPPISDYAKTSRPEDFAEACRLFITNPELLRLLRPFRYKFMSESLKLKPVEERSWDEVIEYDLEMVSKIQEKLEARGKK
jgi:hypothetical protein